MNAKVLSVVVVVLILPMTGCCGNLHQFCHGRGAYCGACHGNSPAYTVVPQVPMAGPAVRDPYLPAPNGCGGPGCGQVYAEPEPVCGTEFGGAYYGAYPNGYPLDESSIGSPVIGSSIYGVSPYDQYNPNSSWIPQHESVVPGSFSTTDGVPLGTVQTPPAPVAGSGQ